MLITLSLFIFKVVKQSCSCSIFEFRDDLYKYVLKLIVSFARPLNYIVMAYFFYTNLNGESIQNLMNSEILHFRSVVINKLFEFETSFKLTCYIFKHLQMNTHFYFIWKDNKLKNLLHFKLMYLLPTDTSKNSVCK